MGLEIDFSKVEARLEAMERKAKSDLIHNTLQAGAKIVEKEIKSEIRKNDHIDTSALYNSIKVTKIVKRGTSSWCRVGIDPNAYNGKGRREPRKVTVYGFILEHGTKYTAGTHWMSKARDKSFEPSKRAIANEIKRRLQL